MAVNFTFTVSEIYVTVLLGITIIGGIINTLQLINFIKESKARFLKSRNPPLIIIYCIIALTTAFTTTPIELYYHGLYKLHADNVPFFASFATELFHEFCTIMLLVLILCRSWLLYYDYKFSECSSDEIWRSIVNEDDNNFWISHRKTLGNLHFIICIALIMNSIALLLLSFVGSFVLQTENEQLFHFVSLFGFGIPLYLFIIYLILYKIKLINDIYLIHKELKYLSICVLVRIFGFFLDMFFLHKYDNYLFFYTLEVLTTFLSVWIQCWWVVNKLKNIEKEKDLDIYININGDINKKKEYQKNKNLLTMIDIFNQQTAFEIFIRHCTHELSVESVLFLIEISQFKATLYRYNAFGIEPLSLRFINAINTNFVEYIKHARKKKVAKQLIIHPLYEQKEDKNISPTPSPGPQSTLPSPSNRSDNDCILALKSSEKQFTVASKTMESEYSFFQQTILNKKWLPLNKLLLDINQTEKSKSKSKSTHTNGKDNHSEKSKTKSKTLTITKSGTGTGTNMSRSAPNSITAMTKTKSISNRSNQISINSTPHTNKLGITPISLAVINDTHNEIEDTKSKSDKETSKSGEKQKSRSANSPISILNKNMTVDVNWIYEYGRYLYLKYVDDNANLSINVSHMIRKDLWSVYSKELAEEAFQKIQLLHHEHLINISRLTHKEEQLFIQTYLYHSFDFAFHAVWTLLKSDTFYRFQKSKKYKTLCEDADKEKIENAKAQRDQEYSRSYKESEIEIP